MLATLGTSVMGTGLDKVIIIAVLTCAAASTQATILPTARSTLSMAAYQALPPSFAKIHPRFFTPTTSTIVIGVISILFYVTMAALSDNILADSALAVGLLIVFHYGSEDLRPRGISATNTGRGSEIWLRGSSCRCWATSSWSARS